MIAGALWEYVLDTPTDCWTSTIVASVALRTAPMGGQRLVFSCFQFAVGRTMLLFRQ
jgi:hypothetical protein